MRLRHLRERTHGTRLRRVTQHHDGGLPQPSVGAETRNATLRNQDNLVGTKLYLTLKLPKLVVRRGSGSIHAALEGALADAVEG